MRDLIQSETNYGEKNEEWLVFTQLWSLNTGTFFIIISNTPIRTSSGTDGVIEGRVWGVYYNTLLTPGAGIYWLFQPGTAPGT